MLSRAFLAGVLVLCCLATTALTQTRNKTVEDFFSAVIDNSKYAEEMENVHRRTEFHLVLYPSCGRVPGHRRKRESGRRRESSHHRPNVTDLLNAQDGNQFPRTARHDPDQPDGAPELNVQYEWFAETCLGGCSVAA